MNRRNLLGAIFLMIILVTPIISYAAEQAAEDQTGTGSVTSDAQQAEKSEYVEDNGVVDPFEPMNRFFFGFNDRFYFWVLKPVSIVYGEFVPEWGRIRVRNVFKNITMPVRFVNSILQLKFNGAAKEVGNFIVNSTAGVGGMFDIMKDNPAAKTSEEDLGQTLGVYGLRDGFYIVWPVLGPSNFRDSLGLVGDYFLDPVNYIKPWKTLVEIRAGERVNSTSLSIGEYEDLKESAIDPYVSVKDAYTQHRRSKIKE